MTSPKLAIAPVAASMFSCACLGTVDRKPPGWTTAEPERAFGRDPECTFGESSFENLSLLPLAGSVAPPSKRIPSRKKCEDDLGGNAARISDRFRQCN